MQKESTVALNSTLENTVIFSSHGKLTDAVITPVINGVKFPNAHQIGLDVIGPLFPNNIKWTEFPYLPENAAYHVSSNGEDRGYVEKIKYQNCFLFTESSVRFSGLPANFEKEYKKSILRAIRDSISPKIPIKTSTVSYSLLWEYAAKPAIERKAAIDPKPEIPLDFTDDDNFGKSALRSVYFDQYYNLNYRAIIEPIIKQYKVPFDLVKTTKMLESGFTDFVGGMDYLHNSEPDYGVARPSWMQILYALEESSPEQLSTCYWVIKAVKSYNVLRAVNRPTTVSASKVNVEEKGYSSKSKYFDVWKMLSLGEIIRGGEYLGSGKYSPFNHVFSDQKIIMRSLTSMACIGFIEFDFTKETVVVSERAKQFLSRLHKVNRDSDIFLRFGGSYGGGDKDHGVSQARDCLNQFFRKAKSKIDRH